MAIVADMRVTRTADDGVFASEVRLQAEQRGLADDSRAAVDGKHRVRRQRHRHRSHRSRCLLVRYSGSRACSFTKFKFSMKFVGRNGQRTG